MTTRYFKAAGESLRILTEHAAERKAAIDHALYIRDTIGAKAIGTYWGRTGFKFAEPPTAEFCDHAGLIYSAREKVYYPNKRRKNGRTLAATLDAVPVPDVDKALAECTGRDRLDIMFSTSISLRQRGADFYLSASGDVTIIDGEEITAEEYAAATTEGASQ